MDRIYDFHLRFGVRLCAKSYSKQGVSFRVQTFIMAGEKSIFCDHEMLLVYFCKY